MANVNKSSTVLNESLRKKETFSVSIQDTGSGWEWDMWALEARRKVTLTSGLTKESKLQHQRQLMCAMLCTTLNPEEKERAEGEKGNE